MLVILLAVMSIPQQLKQASEAMRPVRTFQAISQQNKLTVPSSAQHTTSTHAAEPSEESSKYH